MEIVPTTTPKKKEIGLEGLILRKTELKEQIQNQKILINSSSRKLVSPAAISSYIFSSFKKNMNLVDGIIIGYKLIRTIKRLFRRR
ncbi:MAG: hypothetical protein P4L34_01465 [Paludibacter sp.]|nr:hypothetical protein [Paludibacter sp.]